MWLRKRIAASSLHTHKHNQQRLHKTLILISLFVSTASGLNISKEYDPYLRPNHGAVADICNVSLQIMSISDINMHNNMEFTMDFILTKGWTDPRLQNLVTKETVFMNEFPHKIWIPDIYVENAVQYRYRAEDTMRRTFRVKPEGEVTYSERLAARISCPGMSFMKYPFDKYSCDMKLQSFAYNLINLDMVWNGFLTQDNIQIGDPEFFVQSVGQKSVKQIMNDGQHRTLQASIILRRSGIRAMTHAIIPLTIFALVSYLTLFLSVKISRNCGEDVSQKSADFLFDLSPTQVQIIRLTINGVILTLTTLVSQLHFVNAPRTATVTALDIWCSVISAIVLILLIHNFTTLISANKMGSSVTQEDENHERGTSRRLENWLKLGLPLFLIIFCVIFFALCLT